MSHSLRAPSQTIGPFFHNGLKWVESNQATIASARESVTLFGKVLDGNGEPISDAMLEFWVPSLSDGTNKHHRPHGFARVPTDKDGIYRLHFALPESTTIGDHTYSPHLNVMIFARGLLTPVFTRVYFAETLTSLSNDPVIVAIGDPGRAATLLAHLEKKNAYSWVIQMQGANETVFLERC